MKRHCNGCKWLESETSGSWVVYRCTKFLRPPGISFEDGDIKTVELEDGCYDPNKDHEGWQGERANG